MDDYKVARSDEGVNSRVISSPEILGLPGFVGRMRGSDDSYVPVRYDSDGESRPTSLMPRAPIP